MKVKQPQVIVFFDTETTGKAEFKRDHTDAAQPDLVQLAATLWDERTQMIWTGINAIIHPYDGADVGKKKLFTISEALTDIHGINEQLAIDFGQPRRTILSNFNYMCRCADTLVAYNLDFDWLVMQTAYHREGVQHRMDKLVRSCAMKAATPVVKCPKPAGWKAKTGDEYKWPKLQEAYVHFFGKEFSGAHNAMNDVIALMQVWRELRKVGAL